MADGFGFGRKCRNVPQLAAATAAGGFWLPCTSNTGRWYPSNLTLPLLASDSNNGNQCPKEYTLKLSSVCSPLTLGSPNNWRGCGHNHDLCFPRARDGVSVEGHIVAQCLLNVTQALWHYLSARGWNNRSMVDNIFISQVGTVPFVGCDARESPRASFLDFQKCIAH